MWPGPQLAQRRVSREVLLEASSPEWLARRCGLRPSRVTLTWGRVYALSLKGSTIRIIPPSDTRESDRPARPFVRPAFG
jgi:hypothetical protein